jgi:hypothetical protein
MAYSDRHLWSSPEQTLNGATDLELTFVNLNRVQIHKIALRVTNNAAGGATVVFERRRNVSTDTTIETVVIPAADTDGILVYTEVLTPVVFEPGDVLNLAVTESGTAPTAIALVEYSILDEDLDAIASTIVVESA